MPLVQGLDRNMCIVDDHRPTPKRLSRYMLRLMPSDVNRIIVKLVLCNHTFDILFPATTAENSIEHQHEE